MAWAAEEIAVFALRAAADVLALEADVSRAEELMWVEAAVRDRFVGADVLMNNAGIQPGSTSFATPRATF